MVSQVPAIAFSSCIHPCYMSCQTRSSYWVTRANSRGSPLLTQRLFHWQQETVQCLCKLCGARGSRGRTPLVINLGMMAKWLAALSTALSPGEERRFNLVGTQSWSGRFQSNRNLLPLPKVEREQSSPSRSRVLSVLVTTRLQEE
jgi:hypothetical protein